MIDLKLFKNFILRCKNFYKKNKRKYIPSILPYQKNIDEISETYTIDVKVIGENLMNIALNKDFLYLNIFKVLIPNKYKIIGNELELNFLNKFFLN